MPIDSSSAPLRDLVTQYGPKSPQVTRIVDAVNSSPALETQWNQFAARTTAGGGSPVIRVAPLDDNSRARNAPLNDAQITGSGPGAISAPRLHLAPAHWGGGRPNHQALRLRRNRP